MVSCRVPISFLRTELEAVHVSVYEITVRVSVETYRKMCGEAVRKEAAEKRRAKEENRRSS